MRELILEELLEQENNRFLLSIAAAKRGRQLKEGAKALVEIEPNEYELIIALDELLSKKISLEVGEPEEVSPVTVEEIREEKAKARAKEKEEHDKEKKDQPKKRKRSLNT